MMFYHSICCQNLKACTCVHIVLQRPLIIGLTSDIITCGIVGKNPMLVFIVAIEQFKRKISMDICIVNIASIMMPTCKYMVTQLSANRNGMILK